MKYLIAISAALVTTFSGPAVCAADEADRVSVAAPNTYTSASQNTPSGFPVPRYVSLKYGEVNGRSGPSQNHPVSWRYSRRGLPMIVVAETEMWRKVRDTAGDESWMHKRTLDGKRMVIALQDVMLRAKPRESAKGRAIAAKDSLLELEACDDMGWCEVKAGTGHKGYVRETTLWGAQEL